MPVRRLFLLCAACAVCSLTGASACFAQTTGASYTLVQSAGLVHPGYQSSSAAELTTTGNPFTWGAVDLGIPANLTLGQLNYLSTDYKFVLGSCWAGSPRFEAWVTTPAGTKKVFFYIGPYPTYTGCPSGAWSNTGNLASSTSFVDATEIGGSFYEPYSSVQATYGSYPVTAVYIDADGGWNANQTVEFDNTQLNSELFAYEK